MTARHAEPTGEGLRLAPRAFVSILAALLLFGLVTRLAYVLAQPGSDPGFGRPMLDGAYYLDWARQLAQGEGGPAGAFYLAPLYPYVLALQIAVFGESFLVLYGIQQALLLGAAAVLAWAVRPGIGDAAALAAVGLFVLHHPLEFFASRLLGEPLALGLAVAALGLVLRPSQLAALGAGALAGGAALARPNLLLLPLFWAAAEGARHRVGRAALLLCGTAVVMLPVGLRNLAASGHWVLVSSNSGITSYHGNGPGAGGIYTQPAGFSGTLSRQREEATDGACRISGLDLDAVEADRFWGRQALRTRLADPTGTLGLGARRLLLLVDNWEHGLDDHPMLDSNPWRLMLRWGEGQMALVPFAALLGLSAAGLLLCGVRGSGGWPVWTAIAGCALTPLLFYVSSRYRLPLAAFLTIPAGSGLAALWTGRAVVPGRRREAGLALGLVLAAVSALVSFTDLRRMELAGGLASRASQLQHVGRLDEAERVARRALGLNRVSAPAYHNLAIILAAKGDEEGAERAYRDALAAEPGLAESANNLAQVLRGRAAHDEAIAVLRRTLAVRPGSAECWAQLVLALGESGDIAGARQALERARVSGVDLESPPRAAGAE